MKELIFISSVQKELAAERRAVRDFIRSSPLLCGHFDVCLFEDLPATDEQPGDFYLEKVAECSVFLAIFAKEYGWEHPEDGISPTEREFDLATKAGKHRLVFVKDLAGEKQHPKMAALSGKATEHSGHRRFTNSSDLVPLVYESLIKYLEKRGTHVKTSYVTPGKRSSRS